VITRETLPDGSLRLSVERCSYTIKRLRPGTLHIVVAGQENGELGRAPLGEVAAEAALHPPARLLIDLSGITHVATAVSDDWTAWFRANRNSIRRVDALVASVYLHLTVAVSQVFSRTDDLMQIHRDPATFAAEVRGESQHD
jgi:hypothetical protein